MTDNHRSKRSKYGARGRKGPKWSANALTPPRVIMASITVLILTTVVSVEVF